MFLVDYLLPTYCPQRNQTRLYTTIETNLTNAVRVECCKCGAIETDVLPNSSSKLRDK